MTAGSRDGNARGEPGLPGRPPAERHLDVDHVREGNDDVVAARGEIDVTTAHLLADGLRTAVQHGRGPVVVDLCEVSFMDSSALHVLLNGLRRLTREGRRLSIACSENGRVHRLLSLADLVGTFSVHPSRESAIGEGERLSVDMRRRWTR